MKKLIVAGVAALALAGVAAPAQAEASSYCGVNQWDTTRGGYQIHYVGSRTNGMNCASARYALHEFRAKVRRQYHWPRLGRPFFDGWVTWHCTKISYHGIRCSEYTTGTNFSFRAWVY